MPNAEPIYRPARKSDAVALAALIDIAGEGLWCHHSAVAGLEG